MISKEEQDRGVLARKETGYQVGGVRDRFSNLNLSNEWVDVEMETKS